MDIKMIKYYAFCGSFKIIIKIIKLIYCIFKLQLYNLIANKKGDLSMKS